MSRTLIVIPIYKTVPDKYELISLKQCAVIFKNVNIAFIFPDKLDFSNYQTIFKNNKVSYESFPKHFFLNTDSYNKLLLNNSFYQRFSEFTYLLICQPDAYVFSNELEKWTSKELDYIGAPLIKSIQNEIPEFIPYGGNGGFSLRNNQACLKTLSAFKIMESPKECLNYFKKFHSGFRLWIRFPLIFLRMVGYKNNSKYYINNFDANEDVFWSLKAPLINKNFKVATASEEIPFAFEKHPDILFKMNGNKLPFGCHAWEKHNPDFWKMHIPAH